MALSHPHVALRVSGVLAINRASSGLHLRNVGHAGRLVAELLVVIDAEPDRAAEAALERDVGQQDVAAAQVVLGERAAHM